MTLNRSQKVLTEGLAAALVVLLLASCGPGEPPTLRTASRETEGAPLPLPEANLPIDASSLPITPTAIPVKNGTSVPIEPNDTAEEDAVTLSEKTKDWDYLAFTKMLGEWAATIRCGKDGPEITFTKGDEHEGVNVIDANNNVVRLQYGSAQTTLEFNRSNALARERETVRKKNIRESFRRAKQKLSSLTIPDVENPTHQQRANIETMKSIKNVFNEIENQLDSNDISEKDLSILMMAAESQYRTLTRAMENETNYRGR